MKKGTKIVIGVVLTVFLIIGLVVGGLVGGWVYLGHKVSEFKQKGEQAEIDGREFGKTTDQTGCLEKGYTLEQPKSIYDHSNRYFVIECLKSSRPITNFCEGVPTRLSSKWVDEQCEKVPQSYESCARTMLAKREYCIKSTWNKSK